MSEPVIATTLGRISPVVRIDGIPSDTPEAEGQNSLSLRLWTAAISAMAQLEPSAEDHGLLMPLDVASCDSDRRQGKLPEYLRVHYIGRATPQQGRAEILREVPTSCQLILEWQRQDSGEYDWEVAVAGRDLARVMTHVGLEYLGQMLLTLENGQKYTGHETLCMIAIKLCSPGY